MMRFRKGEKVQIADAQTIKDNSGYVGWNHNMLAMAGEVHTIGEVNKHGEAEFYRLSGCNWSWEDGMLMPYGIKPDIDPAEMFDILEV